MYHHHDIKGDSVDDLTIDDHLAMLLAAQPFVDSAISKTINIADSVTFDEFKDAYLKGWKGKAKGITTYRPSGKRKGILVKVETAEEGSACFIDPSTGTKECS